MSRPAAALCLSLALITTAACATAPDAAPGPADYAAIPTRSEPRAALYADCIEQSASGGTYGAASDGDSDLILFTCTGAPARAFYDGLADRSASVGSEFVSERRTYRSTNRVVRDLFGVDYCSTDGTSYSCVITLNAGAFLGESTD